MPDDRVVDDHLAAVYDAVLVALYQTKQAAWSAASTPYARDLRDLRDFLIEQSRLVDEAETRIDGRAERLSTPSSYQQGNLAAESGGDMALAVRTLTERLVELVSDVRHRAADIEGTGEGELLDQLADGIATSIERLNANQS